MSRFQALVEVEMTLREVIRGHQQSSEFLCVLIVLHSCGEFGSQTKSEGCRKRNLPHVDRVALSIKQIK